jgi:lysophospholipase L1-like esterase
MKIRKTLQISLITIVIIFLFLALFEVGLRITNYQDPFVNRQYETPKDSHQESSSLNYELRPSNEFSGRLGNINIINSNGFRGEELESKKSNFRIAVLGDSIVYGYGMKEKDTFPEKLEKNLKEKGLDSEVLNFGVLGYNTNQEVTAYFEKVKDLDPDLIIVGYVLNDAENRREYSGFEKKETIETCKIAYLVNINCDLKDFLKKFESLKFIKYRLNTIMYENKNSDHLKASHEHEEDYEKNVLEPLRKLSEEEIPKLIVIFPVLKGDYQEVYDKVTEDFTKLGFQVIILDEDFKNKDIQLLKGDPLHPNKLGHEIAANKTANTILNSFFVSSNQP